MMGGRMRRRMRSMMSRNEAFAGIMKMSLVFVVTPSIYLDVI